MSIIISITLSEQGQMFVVFFSFQCIICKDYQDNPRAKSLSIDNPSLVGTV